MHAPSSGCRYGDIPSPDLSGQFFFALRVARVDQPLILYTDSKVSLDKIRAWVLRPGAQAGDKHADIVEEICTHIARYRPGTLTKLLKVPAHTGVEGNEVAD